MAAYKPVTHVIFDMDGLLLDTERLYTEVTQKICDDYGKTFTWEIKSQLMGRKEHDSAKITIEQLGLPLTIEEYLKRLREEEKLVFPSVQFLPGVKKLLTHLHKHNIPMAIASGSCSMKYKWKTVNHQEMFSLFSHVVLSTDDPDVKNGKPAPDCFLLAAKRFPDKPEPEKVLVFEDAPNGVQSGYAAGMQVVWIPDPQADQSLLKDEATLILDSMEDFKPELFGLPPYEN